MNAHSITKFFKQSVLAYFAVTLVTAGLTAALHGITAAEEILSIARVIISLVLIIYLFKRIVGFEQNKYKSIPLLLLPLGVFVLINSVIKNIADMILGFIPLMLAHEVEDAIGFAVSSAITLVICITLITKYIECYAVLYEEKKALIFPKTFRLSSKWWFVIAGELVGGIVYASLSSLAAFAALHLVYVFNAVGIIVEYAIIYGFFNAALKSIDKETRKLFLPNIFLVTVATMVMTVFDAVNKFVPILSLSNALERLRDEMVDLQFLISLIPAILVNLVLSLLALFLGCWLCKKNFEAYEEK